MELGPGAGTAIEGQSCAAEEECLDLGRGRVGCVVPPARPCEPASFSGRCLGGGPTICARPDGFIESWYEVEGPPCTEPWRVCEMVHGLPTCVLAPAFRTSYEM